MSKIVIFAPKKQSGPAEKRRENFGNITRHELSESRPSVPKKISLSKLTIFQILSILGV